MRRRSFLVSLFTAAGLFGAGLYLVPEGLHAARLVAAQDDPVALTDVLLPRAFDAAAAAREIDAALAADDPELARSFIELAQERGIAVDSNRVAAVDTAARARGSAAGTATRFARGFLTGVPDDAASLAGTAAGDLTIYGDLRDTVREGAKLARGEQPDMVVLALAGAGLAVTAGTYASLGIAAPARAGLSVVKAAKRTGRLGTDLIGAVRRAKPDEIVRLAGDVGALQARAGTRAALDGLALARSPGEVAKVAALAAAKGGKTRAIVKTLGRGAVVLTRALAELAGWVIWAIANLVSFAAAVKRTTEDLTRRVLRRRKARAAAMRRAGLAAAAASG